MAEKQKSKAHRARKISLPKGVRNTLISAGVLLVLLVLGGVLYTYFMGSQNGANIAAATPVAATVAQPIKPHKLAPNVPESAAVEMLTSPVPRGANSSITVKTNPGSTCKITVVYDKVPSMDSGLSPKVADDFGIVSWAWTVGDSVPVGTWPVTVTCASNKHTAVVMGDLQVTK